MSSENVWSGILQELCASKLPFLPDSTGPEPWLSYKAIAHLTGQKEKTIENKCGGIRRHPVFCMVKLSELEAKFSDDEETT